MSRRSLENVHIRTWGDLKDFVVPPRQDSQKSFSADTKILSSYEDRIALLETQLHVIHDAVYKDFFNKIKETSETDPLVREYLKRAEDLKQIKKQMDIAQDNSVLVQNPQVRGIFFKNPYLLSSTREPIEFTWEEFEKKKSEIFSTQKELEDVFTRKRTELVDAIFSVLMRRSDSFVEQLQHEQDVVKHLESALEDLEDTSSDIIANLLKRGDALIVQYADRLDTIAGDMRLQAEHLVDTWIATP